jgi:uncharacterized damage-inducible protein DinB
MAGTDREGLFEAERQYMHANDLQRLAAFSERVRESTLKRLLRVPEGKENARLPGGAMSPADIAHHLIHIDRVLVALPETRHKGQDPGTSGQRIVRDRSEYDALLSELEDLKKKRRDFIAGLDDDTLSMTITFDALTGGGETTFAEMIYRLLDHEAHHRGALAATLRMIERGF